MDDTYEDLSFLEKTQYKLNELKEEFLHLPVWQKIALIVAGSILATILFYAFFTATKLSQIKKISQPPTRTNQTNAPASTVNKGQQKNTEKDQSKIDAETRTINKSSPSATANTDQSVPQTTGGVADFIQNLLVGGSQSSSSSTSEDGTITITGTSKTTSTQNAQPTSAPQQYIVNFLNGVLYFQDPQTGQVTPYILSGVNPADFTWGRYTNSADGYSIDYPTNWTMIKRNDSGHEGLSLYPPEENPGNNDAKQIGLGWSARYLLPTTGGTEIYYQTSITINNTLGQLFTLGGGDQGGRGTAVLLPHRFGYFGLGGSADTSEFIYVFQHMLSSLSLTK